jgi:hypothetical protein
MSAAGYVRRRGDMATAATRRVKFYIAFVTGMPASVQFEVGDEIEFEGEPLVVRAVEPAGAWSGHPDALAADLVVRLTKHAGRFEKLHRAAVYAPADEPASGGAGGVVGNRGARAVEREDVSGEGAA